MRTAVTALAMTYGAVVVVEGLGRPVCRRPSMARQAGCQACTEREGHTDVPEAPSMIHCHPVLRPLAVIVRNLFVRSLFVRSLVVRSLVEKRLQRYSLA